MLKIVKNIFPQTFHKIMKVNIFFRPEEVILGYLVKACLSSEKNFLFLEKLKPSSALKITTVVILDLSCCFDTVDHDMLLTVLKDPFGLCDNALSWFEKYL